MLTHSFDPAGRLRRIASVVSRAPRVMANVVPAFCKVHCVPSQFKTCVHGSSAGSRTSAAPDARTWAAAATISPHERLEGQSHMRNGGASAGTHLLNSKTSPGATFASAGRATLAEERARPSKVSTRSTTVWPAVFGAIAGNLL